MPKKLDETVLKRVEKVVNRHPDGVGIADLMSELSPPIPRRTLARYLTTLVETRRIARKGGGRASRYHPLRPESSGRPRQPETGATFETPDGPVNIPLSRAGKRTLDYVSRAVAERTPVTYDRRLLDEYDPNNTTYLPEATRARLHQVGRPIVAQRAAGTFVRDILGRLLIDLSWSSSRLEGNTYTRLDTQRLIEFGEVAEGKDAKEAQMILNHKRAIELLVDGGNDIGINRYTILNLHALLSEDLMADPEAAGRLRRRPVEIGHSVYVPLAVQQVIEETLDVIIEKASAITDPFEQSFFVMVHIPYLQPFEDVNKRVSRLAANVPLIRSDLCPLSFIDVPERAYVAAMLGIYEAGNTDLLCDVFAWAYERSCRRYVVVRDSLVEPDAFRMKYRAALAEVIGSIVSDRQPPTAAAIEERAAPLVKPEHLDTFTRMAELELHRLYEGNIARYRITLAEYRDWRSSVARD